MKFNKTTILLGTALVLTVVAGGAYTFFFIVMKDKTQATAELSAKMEELSGKQSRVASALSVLKNEASQIEKLSAYFIKESEIVAFTKKIEALGPQSGTALTLESLEPGLTEKTVPYLNFRIKATGKFAAVMRFLVLLENFPGKFEWKTVRLVRADTSGQQVSATTTRRVDTPEWSVEVFLSALNFVKE